MPDYVIAPPPITAVRVVGRDELFPVRRVYCVGRNYADHAREMGVDPRAEEPFFFLKPADTVLCSIDDGALTVPYPPATKDLQHEVELVVAIGRDGEKIPAGDAIHHIWGYAVGIDMTRRDRQLAMRASGKPWEIGKTFERCAPVSAIMPITLTGEMLAGTIALNVGSERRQSSDLSRMTWSVSEIVAKLSEYFVLRTGDLIFTGTPEGVGAVTEGDRLTASIEGLGELRVDISSARSEI